MRSMGWMLSLTLPMPGSSYQSSGSGRSLSGGGAAKRSDLYQ